MLDRRAWFWLNLTNPLDRQFTGQRPIESATSAFSISVPLTGVHEIKVIVRDESEKSAMAWPVPKGSQISWLKKGIVTASNP